MKKFALFALLIIVLSGVASAEPNRIISNSDDWRDVYSTLLYANLLNKQANFLVSTSHSTLLLFSVNKGEELEVISSEDNRYIVGYDEIILGQGYPEESAEYVYDNVNLELAERLDNINKYIIIDDSYGYNALSVAPYAKVDDYYVLFVDDRTIGRVENFLEDKNPESIIIYGTVNREVKDRLAQFNPEVINEGDRFDNNFAIVDKYLQVKPTRQAILTSGEFIEPSMMTGFDPVIFIGKTNVPDKVRDYIQRSDFDVGILIGNELVAVATSIRRQVGISVFVKFAQGARRPTAAISQVEDLDRFPMPSFDLDIDIDSVDYNTATQSLEITYRNNVGIGTYIKGTIRINQDGEQKLLADEESFFLDGDEIKTLVYEKLTNGDNLLLSEAEATGQVFAIYGEAPNALEFEIERNFDVSFIDVLDSSEIEIVSAVYDTTRNGFEVVIENTGNVDVYASVEIYDLLVNDQEGAYASGEIPLIKVGSKSKHFIKVELDDQDILDNDNIYVRGFYGERANALIKIAEAEFPFEVKSGIVLIIIVVIVIILLLLLLFFVKRTCKHCKTKNFLWKTRCKRCKARL